MVLPLPRSFQKWKSSNIIGYTNCGAISPRRIAKQVGTLYSEVAASMLCAPLATHFDRSWSGHVGVKAALYEVQALLDSAAALHADDKIGAEIARLKVRCQGSTLLGLCL